MTKIRNNMSTSKAAVDKYIGTSYDVIKAVYDNLADIVTTAGAIDDGSIAETLFEIKTEAQLGSQAISRVFTFVDIDYVAGTNRLSVYRNGQRLILGDGYTETGTTQITLTFDPLPTEKFLFITNERTDTATEAPATTNVVHERITATAGQTVVNTTTQYTIGANNITVFRNGVLQTSPTEYTETTATSITFVNSLTLGDNVDVFIGLVLNPVDVVVSNYKEHQLGSAAVSRVFTLSKSYAVGTENLTVLLNGVELKLGTEYTETSNTSVTLTYDPLDNSEYTFKIGSTIPSTVTDAVSVSYTPSGAGAVTTNVQAKLREVVTPYDFDAEGDGSTDDTTAITNWLTDISTNNRLGWVPHGTFMCDSISLAIANGIKIDGVGTIKATGSNRLNMLLFTGTGASRVEIDGITIDANNKVARPLEIQNTSATSSTLGQAYFGPKLKVKNAKNNDPDTYTVAAIRVHGGFSDVTFEGEIDTCDSDSTSGAVTVGLWSSWTGSGDDWVRHTRITSNAKIKNVKNDNTVLADADGVQATAPTDKYAKFSVAPGAYFENCEGRSIKSQVVGNQIIGPVILRDAYDGLNEINLQYAGGIVANVVAHYDGQRANNLIAVSQNATPDNTHCTISDNELTISGTPGSNVSQMISFDVTGAAVKAQGVTIRGNKCKGTAIEYMCSFRVANTVDVNRFVIDGNWCESVNTAFFNTTLYGSSRAQCTVVFINNGSEAAVTGASITEDLIVEYAANNHNISRLITLPYNVTIATGAVTVYGQTHRVDTESSAASDDLDTITPNSTRDPDEWLTLYANNSARTVVLKDGTGNLKLAGDFSLDNTEDRITLAYDGTNWVEMFRSNNGA